MSDEFYSSPKAQLPKCRRKSAEKGGTSGAAEEVPEPAREELTVEVHIPLRLLLDRRRIQQDRQERDDSCDDNVRELFSVEDRTPLDGVRELGWVALVGQGVPVRRSGTSRQRKTTSSESSSIFAVV